MKAPHKGEKVTVTDPSITKQTQLPEVVIFLDKSGNPYRTATEVVVLVPGTPTAVPAAKTTAKTVAPNQVSVRPFLSSTSSAASAPKPLPSAATNTSIPATPDIKSPADSNADTSGLHGVTYSPYNSDGSCKSAGQVLSDFQQLKGQYGLVRIYGVDCDQVNTVMQAASSIGVKLMLGVFNLDGLDGQVGQLVSAVKSNGGWDSVSAISVGNELVNNGQATPNQVIDAVTSARQSLRSAGYQGPVVTVDTFVAVQKNPQLCDSSDFCAMNIHPFFDPNTSPEAAGDFVARQVANTRQVLKNPNKRVVVTESGWPWQGSANGQAVPGKDNQQTAVDSIKTNYGAQSPGDLILFTAFNDLWKKAEPGTFYAEQYWGMVSRF